MSSRTRKTAYIPDKARRGFKLQVRIDPELRDALETRASARGMSIQDHVRDLIRRDADEESPVASP